MLHRISCKILLINAKLDRQLLTHVTQKDQTKDKLFILFDTVYFTPFSNVNGDGFVDSADVTIVDNNAANFVSAVTP